MRQFLIGLILLFVSVISLGQSQSSDSVKIEVHWSQSVPFIYKDANGKFGGIEYEMLLLFQEYMNQHENTNIQFNWVYHDNFGELISSVQNASSENVFGISAFSITDERKEILKFSTPYMADITVLVSSKGTPIVNTFAEINNLMAKMEAVTIESTLYETLLFDLKDQLNLDFKINYIDSDKNILENISAHNDRFGFIDLPIYLMLIKNGGDLTRQNFFTVKGDGYSVIVPKKSPWDTKLNQFLDDNYYKEEIGSIISKYMGVDLYEFINTIDVEDQLGTSILTKEKEIQLALIRNANLKLAEEKMFKRVLIGGVIISVLFLLIIGFLFYRDHKITNQVLTQKDQIESQQEDIRQKNDQLINRNTQLIAINEEKNNLMNILAHDLRSPLTQIIAMAQLTSTRLNGASEETKEFLDQIQQGAHRINKMIDKILNTETLENDKSLVLKEKVNVQNLLKDLAHRYRPMAAKKGIYFDLKIPSSFPEIETDHMLLFLVLENLISNAIKFSPPETKVAVEVEDKNETILLKVTDEGPGFTKEDKSRLFNRFETLSAKPTGNETSTGLGLSIVKKYVTDLGGQVWLESEEKKGSTFFVSLPT